MKRYLWKSIPALLTLMFVLTLNGCQKKSGTSSTANLVVVSFGGQWQAAQDSAIFQPFEKRYHVHITQVVYNGDYSLIKEKAKSGEWDVIDVEPPALLMGSKDSIFEPIDYSLIDTSQLISQAIQPYGLGVITFAIVMGYNIHMFKPGAPHPTSWKDFWNTKKFPGMRALHDDPQWMLEIALMADGTPKNRIYPINMNKAFKELDKIRSKTILFDTWSQPAQLIQRGQVSMTVGTNGRLLAAEREGVPLAISWNDGIFAVEYYAIATGSKHKDLAQKFLAFAASDSVQKNIPSYIDYGPTNRLALTMIDSSIRKDLPTSPENYPKLVAFDPEWWLVHKAEAIKRYDAWSLK